MKRCTTCHQEFPATLEYFIPNTRNKSGICARCRTCAAEVRRLQTVARQERYTQARADVPAVKRCSICGNEYPATTEYFYGRKGTRDGLRNECQKCLEDRNRRWQDANHERVLANARRRTNNYRGRNRSAVLKNTREWKANNPDKIKNYRDANRGNFAVYSRRRKDRVAGLPNLLTPEQWQFALDYFGHCCAVCGRPLDGLFHTPAIDHWIPVSNPECPGTVATNTVPLCHGIGGCNNSKGPKDPEDWLVTMLGSKGAHKILSKINLYFASVTP
jgi:hypothetical protein